MLWWSVLAATIAGWAISIGVIYYPCALATLEYEAGRWPGVVRLRGVNSVKPIAVPLRREPPSADPIAFRLELIFPQTSSVGG